jgi:hypothetical protein
VSRDPQPGAGLPVLYTPEEVGTRLGRSSWWVKDQCRRGRFPCIRAGGAIRFTEEQIIEILVILEQRPGEPAQRHGSTVGRRRSQTLETSVEQLRARPPRRTPKVPPPGEGRRTA